MEMIFMNTENNKTNEPRNFVFTLTQKLELRSSRVSILLFKTCLFITSGKR